jgi:hypothetical protein
MQTGSWPHPAYPMGTRGSSLEVKWQRREADPSPPTSAKVKKMWIYTATHPYALFSHVHGQFTLQILHLIEIHPCRFKYISCVS